MGKVYLGATGVAFMLTASFFALQTTTLNPARSAAYSSVPAPHVAGVAATGGGGGLFYIAQAVPPTGTEAESAAVTTPLQKYTDASAFGGQYIATPTANAGKAVLAFSVPTTGVYAIWGRVFAGNSVDPDAANTFHVSMDADVIDNVATDGNSTIWDTPQVNAWAWSQINKRIGGNMVDTAVTYNLTAGSHTLYINGREPNSRIDQIIVTSDLSFVPTASPADTTPPSTPSGLGATPLSSSQINLSWTASTDTIGVTGYRVYRNGTQIAMVTTPLYQDTGLAAVTTYSYTVSAYDAAGNASSQSSSVSATTQSAPVADLIPPTVSLTAPAGGATVSGNAITVSANASDNIGVAGVQFKLDGTNLATEDTASPYSITWDTTTATNGSHTLTATARDAAGNTTTATAITVTVLNVVVLPPPVSTSSMWVVVYYPTWAQRPLGVSGYGLPPIEVDWTGVTHVVHFFGDNSVVATSPYFRPAFDTAFDNIARFGSGGGSIDYQQQLINTVHSKGGKVVIDLQDITSGALMTITANQAQLDIFADAVAAYANQRGYDGVELDWEFWSTGSNPSTAQMSALIRTLKQKMNATPNLKLIIAAPGIGQDEFNLYNTPEGKTMVDMYTLQMYAYSGINYDSSKGANVAWYMNPLYIGDTRTVAPGFQGSAYNETPRLLVFSIKGWLAGGMDSKKLGIGLPSFARIYHRTDTFLTTYTSAGWFDEISIPNAHKLLTNGGIEYFDAQRRASYIAGTALRTEGRAIAGEKFWVTIPEPSDIQEDVNWAKSLGLGSVMMYEIAKDANPSAPFGQRHPIMSAIVSAVNSGVTPPPPADTTPPIVSLSAPTGGATVSGSVTVSANAIDNIGVVGVQFILDGASLGTEDTSSPYSVIWNTTTATNGSHILTATARDVAGNMTTATNVSVTVSNVVVTPPPSSSSSMWVTAYYAGWMQAYYPPSAIDFGAFTHIIHFEAFPTISGGVLNSDLGSSADKADLISRAHAAGKKVLYSIGGWYSRPEFEGAMSSVNRATFVTNLVNFMTTYGYDGIDIDMEDMVPANQTDYRLFITDLRAALDLITPRPLLTAAVGWQYQIFATLADKFDQLNLMTYDMSGAWQGWVTWHNSPITNNGHRFPSSGGLLPAIDTYVDDFVAATGIAKSKIGVGIDFYGFVWSGGTGTPTGGATAPEQGWTTAPSVQANVPYSTIMSSYYTPAVYRFDTNAGVPYLSIDNTGSANDKYISYDDEEAIRRKVAYVGTKQIGGVIVWEIAGGYRATQPAGQRDLLLQALKAATAGAKFKIGDRVQTTATLNVRATPTTTGTLLGTQSTGALGSVIGGPTAADGFNWWNINYDSGVDGWSVEDWLVLTALAPPADTTSPTVSLTAPPSGATVSGSVTVSANASDNIGVVGVQFKLDGSNLGGEDTTSPYSLTWDTTTALNSSHTLTATARDAAGNVTTATNVSVTVSNTIIPPPSGDITRPQITISSPSNGAIITAGTTVTIQASASDNVSVTKVDFYNGTTLLGTDTSSPYSFAWNTTGVPTAQTIYTRAYDAAGNIGVAGVTVFFGSGGTTRYMDQIFTSAEILKTSGKQFSTITDQYGTHTLLMDIYTPPASDPVAVRPLIIWIHGGNFSGGGRSDFAAYSIEFARRGYVAATIDYRLFKLYNPSALTNDAVQAAQVDTEAAINYLKANAATYRIDANLPIVGGWSAGSATSWRVGYDYEYLGRTAPVVRGTVPIDAENLKPTDFRAGDPPWNWIQKDTSDEYPEPYIVQSNSLGISNQLNKFTGASHTDLVAAPLTPVISKIVARFLADHVLAVTPPPSADTTPPTVALTAPASGATLSGTVTVSANASDNVAVAGVQFKVDGVNLGSEDTTVPYSLTWDTTAVGNGSRIVAAVARDSAGNSTFANPLTVTVSNVVVTPPSSGKWLTVYYTTQSETPSVQTPDQVNWTGVTHIVHGGNDNVSATIAPYFLPAVPGSQAEHDLVFGPDGSSVTDYQAMLINTAHQYGAKVAVSVVDSAACALTTITSDPVKLAAFVNATVNYAKTKGYDGIEVDWEDWACGVKITKAGVTALYTSLRNQMDTTWGPGKALLTSPSSWDASKYDVALDTIIDQYNLQMYEFATAHVGSSNAVWYISPLYRGTVPANFDGSAWAGGGTNAPGPQGWTAAGHNPNKLGMGTPLYGLIIPNNDQIFQMKVGSSHEVVQEGINLLKNTNGGIEGWDDQRKVPYISGTATANVTLPRSWPSLTITTGQKFFITYENVQSIQEKVAWIKASSYGGMMMFRSDEDLDRTKPVGQKNPLISAAANALGASPSSDTTPPTVSLTVPASGVTVSGSAVTVSANASDNIGVAGVQFKLDGVNLSAEDTTSPYGITWNTTVSTNGSHTLTATARDAAGNMTTASNITITVSNIIVTPPGDTTPPTVSLTFPLNGDTIAAGSIAVAGTATDNVGVTSVQVQLDSGTPAAASGTTSFTYTLATASLANGSHTITALARDAAGNQGTTTVTVTIANATGADTTPPVISNVQVGSITPSSTPVSWDTNEPADSLVQYGLAAGALSLTQSVSALTTTHSVNLSNLMRNTTYYYSVRSRDAAGNQATASATTSFKTLRGKPAKVRSLQARQGSVILSWESHGDSLVQKLVVLRRTDAHVVDPVLEVAAVVATLTDPNQTSFTDVNVTPGTTYYYSVYTVDDAGVYSDAAQVAFTPQVSTGSAGGGGGGGGSGYSGGGSGSASPPPASNQPPVSTPVPDTITRNQPAGEGIADEAAAVYLHNQFVQLLPQEAKLYRGVVEHMAAQPTERARFALAKFIQDGTPSTVRLGSGERAGVVSSFSKAFAKLPYSQVDWQDVLKLATGQAPTKRNLKREQAVTPTFRRIYRRQPKAQLTADQNAITILAYGLRVSPRNLASERAAIKTFRSVYRRAPSTASDWDTVRAIAYSGARR